MTRFAVLVALVGLAPAGTAGAQTVPHQESCDGHMSKFVPPTATEPGFMGIDGLGEATHMGKYRILGGHSFTPDGQLEGPFTSTAADGSTVSGNYTGVFYPVGGTLFQFEVTVVWTEGTKRLAGVTGEASIVATLDMATGQFHYDTDGTWTLP